ncbi:MAG: YybH family protein [Candidatus Promineifilaceae bacterium]
MNYPASTTYRLPFVSAVLLLVASLTIACMPVSPVTGVKAQSPSEGPDIEAFWDEYVAANVTGDAERWIALWDENGVQMPPNSPFVDGMENILARKEAGNEKWITDEMTISNQEVEVAGGWAFVRGVYDAKMTPKAGGESTFVDGKYMSILKQQPDGSWKLYRDIFNSN